MGFNYSFVLFTISCIAVVDEMNNSNPMGALHVVLAVFTTQSRTQSNAVRGLGLALALGKRNEIRNFIGCREINNLGAA